MRLPLWNRCLLCEDYICTAHACHVHDCAPVDVFYEHDCGPYVMSPKEIADIFPNWNISGFPTTHDFPSQESPSEQENHG